MSGVPTHQLLMSNRRTVTPIEGPELLEDTGKECPRTGHDKRDRKRRVWRTALQEMEEYHSASNYVAFVARLLTPQNPFHNGCHLL